MPITPDDITLMDVQQGGRCFYCDEPVGAKATIDHLIPQAYGGRDEPANAVLAHRRCNQRKADRLPTPDELDRFFTARRASRLGIWPPLRALRDAAEGDEWIAVARAVSQVK